MKSKEEILSFIKTIKPQNKVDEAKILQYCSKIGESVSFYDYSYRRVCITFSDFKSWVESSQPKVGDTIAYEQYLTIGIVSRVTEESIYLGVAILGLDGLITSDVERPNKNYRYATEDEILRVHQLLTRKGFTWNIWRNILIKRIFIPRCNLYIKFRSYIKDECGIGVFREINTDGKLVMYCAACNNKPVRYSLYEIIGDAYKFQLAPANKADITFFKQRLETGGKLWNGYYNRIEPIDYSIDYGDKYYYINDKGDIKSAKKNDSEAYRKRLALGNLFVNISQAEELREEIRQYRKVQLSRPNWKRNFEIE